MEKLLNSNPDSYLENESEFKALLNDEKSWRLIPLINYSKTHELKDLSLVRFRGMIQDMLDPEFYMAKYEVTSCDTNNVTKRIQNGKYRDCLAVQPTESVNYDSELLQRDDRRTLFVITIPGLNDWVVDVEKTATPKPNSIINLETEQGLGKKRNLEDKDEFMEIDSVTAGCSHNTQETENNKKLKIVQRNDKFSSNNKILSNEFLLNSPIPQRPSSACMVKIYSDLDSYYLNSIVDVVGFLSLDPALDGTMEDPSDFEDINEIQATNPPPSLIPRLHAIAVRKLKHSNPLVDASLTNFEMSSFINLESIYNDIKIALIQALFGDELAAEYLLCHLISTVYVRTNSETLGQFSLNLCNIPSEVLPKYTNEFYEIIESLLPASHYLPMSLETMNEQIFVPTKDYETNRLTAGLLQLAPTTHLILDETRLQPGKLESNGIVAVQHLAKIIKSQEIKYNFKFYEIDFDTDIPVMILSEGRSLLPSNVQVPLKPDSDCVKLIEETLKAAKYFLLPKINLIRTYLTKAKLSEFVMDTDVTKIIENDFVEMRKGNNKIGPDELHSLLVLSRLLGICQGRTEFDHDCWNKAKEMEKERNIRLNELPKTKNTTRN